MDSVIDIIHNLSYQVSGTGLDDVIKKMQQQADGIETLKSKLSDLQKAYGTAQNVQQQQNIQAAIDKTTRSIDLQTAALQKAFAGNKQLQEALNDEIGLIQQLTQFIARATKERETLTDVNQIRAYTEQIKAAKAELASLVATPTTIRQVGAIEALTNRITILKNTLKTVPKDNIAAINIELEKSQKELFNLQSLGKNTDSKGGIFASIFGGGGSIGRQVLSGTLMGLGIGSGFGLITRAVSGLAEYAQAELDVVGKTEKLKSANDALAKSFDNLADAISKYDQETELLNANGNYDNTVEGLQRKADTIKAIGAVNGQVGNAELDQLKATQDARQQELKVLNDKLSVSEQLRNLYEQSKKTSDEFANRPDVKGFGDPHKNINVQYELFNNFNAAVQNANIPEDIRKELDLSLKKGYKDGADLLKLLADETRKYSVDTAKLNQEVADKKSQIDTAQVAYDAKLRDEEYNKNKELALQLADQKETLRQLSEKEDAASVDKIVADAQAKYKALYNTIYRNAVNEAKVFPGFNPDRPLDNLPKPLRNKYNGLFGDNKEAQRTDTNNQVYEYTQGLYSQTLSNANTLAQDEATHAANNANFGLPDYNALVIALDKDTAARKEALHTQFVNQVSAIQDSTQVIEAQKQYDQKLIDTDREAYTKRLALGNEYFEKLTQNIQSAAQLISLQLDTDLQNRITKIYKGKGSLDDKADKEGLIKTKVDAQQQQNIINEENEKEPTLQSNANKSEEAATAAQGTSNQQAAINQYYNDAIAYQLSLNKKATATADYQKDIAKINDESTKEIIKAIDITQTLADATQAAYETIANARQQDLDREIEVRTQRVDMAEKLAERGNTTALAQEQKALDTANQQKRQAALQEQEINAALTESNLILAVAKAAAQGEGIFSFAIIASVIAAVATGIAEVVSLNASTKQSFAEGVVNFKGKGGPTDDANTVNISSGESVITAAATAKYGNILEAMNKGLPLPLAQTPYTHPKTMTTIGPSIFASKEDFHALGRKLDAIQETIDSKQVHVAQHVTKSGIHQIVKEEQKAHANKLRP